MGQKLKLFFELQFVLFVLKKKHTNMLTSLWFLFFNYKLFAGFVKAFNSNYMKEIPLLYNRPCNLAT